MEWKFRYLFTLCLIMGFQIHLPVTMFPADGTSENHSDIIQSLSDYTMNVVESDSASNHLIQKENRDGDHRDGVLIKSISTESKQSFHPGANGLEAIPNQNINGRGNQASHRDLDKFNIGVNPNGLERDLGTTYSKSAKSMSNRLSPDLRINKIQQLERRLANLSTNLLSRKNILPGNNGRDVVNGVKMNAIDIDTHNNGEAIKSEMVSTTPPSKFETLNDTSHGRYKNIGKGILWSDNLVNNCPQGFKGGEISEWKQKINNLTVIKIETGCGSMQNRLITFSDSSKACVRYRLNSDQMQGDIYSYYLGKLLGINYTPPTTLQVLENKQLWREVMGDINAAKWSEDKPLIVSKWKDSLESVYMPDKLKDMKRGLHLKNYQLDDTSSGHLCDLVQWSDLIVFDYISANLDRVVNNMFNLKWNHKMLEKPIHNLERSKKTGQLVFLDNESGLFHGYRLLDTYENYHKTLLDSICIFKPSTVAAVRKLYVKSNAGDLLQSLYERNEPYHSFLPRMSKQNIQILQTRINTVYKHMELCEHAT
ncbi:Four-jointed box protein 1 [Mactra antiquata]